MHLLISSWFLLLYRRDFNNAKKVFWFVQSNVRDFDMNLNIFLPVCSNVLQKVSDSYFFSFSFLIRNSEVCLRTHLSLLCYEQRLMNDKTFLKITLWNSFWSVSQNEPLWHYEWMHLCLVRRNFSYETKAVAAEEQRTEVKWSTSDRSASMWNHYKTMFVLFTRETLAGADPVCMNTSAWLYFGVKFALRSYLGLTKPFIVTIYVCMWMCKVCVTVARETEVLMWWQDSMTALT